MARAPESVKMSKIICSSESFATAVTFAGMQHSIQKIGEGDPQEPAPYMTPLPVANASYLRSSQLVSKIIDAWFSYH
jgi:hypothetical protein